MAGGNKVILVGNLGADPEARSLPSGGEVVNLRVATSESGKDRNSGERQERTEWHRVVIFNENLGRVAKNYLRKGSKVYLEGQLQTRKWTDQSGQEKYSTEVVLQNFRGELVLLDSREGGGGGGRDFGGGLFFGRLALARRSFAYGCDFASCVLLRGSNFPRGVLVDGCELSGGILAALPRGFASSGDVPCRVLFHGCEVSRGALLERFELLHGLRGRCGLAGCSLFERRDFLSALLLERRVLAGGFFASRRDVARRILPCGGQFLFRLAPKSIEFMQGLFGARPLFLQPCLQFLDRDWIRGARRGLLRHGDFLKLWAGETISMFGSQVDDLALGFVAIIVLDASAFEVAVLGTLNFLPFIIFALPAGVWVDRLRRRA